MTAIRFRSAVLAPALALIAAAGSGAAAEAPARAPAVQAVLDCRALAGEAQRLACYDRAVAAMAKAEESGDLVSVDREQRRALRRQAFGFNLPTLSMFDRGTRPEENERLTGQAASVARNAQGQWVITLEDGAVWAQTDDAQLYPYPKPGSAIAIRRGALGSFFMTIDRRQDVRAKRVG